MKIVFRTVFATRLSLPWMRYFPTPDICIETETNKSGIGLLMFCRGATVVAVKDGHNLFAGSHISAQVLFRLSFRETQFLASTQ